MRNKGWYQSTERIIYNYEELCEEYELLTQEYKYLELFGDVRTQSYGEHVFSGCGSDRVADHVHRKIQIEKRLRRLYPEINGVSKVYRRLTRDMSLHAERLQKVLERIYFRQDKAYADTQDKDTLSRMKRELVIMISRSISRCRKRLRK